MAANLTAEAVFGILHWMFRWYRPDGERAARDIGEYFATLVARGVAAEGT